MEASCEEWAWCQFYFQHLAECLVKKRASRKHILTRWILKAGYRTIIIKWSLPYSFPISTTFPPVFHFFPSPAPSLNKRLARCVFWCVLMFFLYSSHYLNSLDSIHLKFFMTGKSCFSRSQTPQTKINNTRRQVFFHLQRNTGVSHTT